MNRNIQNNVLNILFLVTLLALFIYLGLTLPSSKDYGTVLGGFVLLNIGPTDNEVFVYLLVFLISILLSAFLKELAKNVYQKEGNLITNLRVKLATLCFIVSILFFFLEFIIQLSIRLDIFSDLVMRFDFRRILS